jgi:hypothetical protein
MANLGEIFDVEFLPQGKTSFDPIPAGWYTATIASAEVKATKNGTGQYIAIRYDVTGPTHQGRVIFGNLNIRNASPKAEEIGRQQLGELCRAIGLAKVGDTDQLVGHGLSIKVDIEKSEQYGDKNQVRGFKPIAGGAPSVPVRSSVQNAPAAPAKAAPPWAKK